jgi:hypothetical protein
MITAKDFDKIVNRAKRTATFEMELDCWLESIVKQYKEGERTFELPNLSTKECIDSLSERGFHVTTPLEGYDWVTLSIPPYKV